MRRALIIVGLAGLLCMVTGTSERLNRDVYGQGGRTGGLVRRPILRTAGPRISGRVTKGKRSTVGVPSIKRGRQVATAQKAAVRPLRESIKTLKSLSGAQDQVQQAESSSGAQNTLIVTPRNPVRQSGDVHVRMHLAGAAFSPDAHHTSFSDAYTQDIAPLRRSVGIAQVLLSPPEGWYLVEAQFFPNNVTAQGKMTASVGAPDPFEAEIDYQWTGGNPIGLVYFPVVVHVGPQGTWVAFTCTRGDVGFRGISVQKLR